jgi:hypothetical protein
LSELGEPFGALALDIGGLMWAGIDVVDLYLSFKGGAHWDWVP